MKLLQLVTSQLRYKGKDDNCTNKQEFQADYKDFMKLAGIKYVRLPDSLIDLRLNLPLSHESRTTHTAGRYVFELSQWHAVTVDHSQRNNKLVITATPCRRVTITNTPRVELFQLFAKFNGCTKREIARLIYTRDDAIANCSEFILRLEDMAPVTEQILQTFPDLNDATFELGIGTVSVQLDHGPVSPRHTMAGVKPDHWAYYPAMDLRIYYINNGSVHWTDHPLGHAYTTYDVLENPESIFNN